MIQDILLNDELDIAAEGGDLIIADSTLQHQLLLLQLNKGDLKEHPTAGVGIRRYLNDESAGGLLGDIKREYEIDGMNVTAVRLNADGKLTVEASYD